MNIQTVAENLRNTIAGKEMLLDTYKNPGILTKPIRETMAHMLEVNIDELKRILQDVEQCVFDYDELKEDLKEANGRVRQLEKQASDDSWVTNPDRSGGSFTQEEIDYQGWK